MLLRNSATNALKTLRQAKRDYYGNLDVKSITDNRKFWKTVKPLFSEKVQTSSDITLLKMEPSSQMISKLQK